MFSLRTNLVGREPDDEKKVEGPDEGGRRDVGGGPRRRPPTLFVMVGPSGAGKSTLAARAVERGEFAPFQVVSSDLIREHLLGSRDNHTQNERVAGVMHRLLDGLLACGLDAVADATHLVAKYRRQTAELALRRDARLVYWLADRPLEDKVRDGGFRNEVMTGGDTLVRRHHDMMARALPDVLTGDGFQYPVTIRDSRDEKLRE